MQINKMSERERGENKNGGPSSGKSFELMKLNEARAARTPKQFVFGIRRNFLLPGNNN